MLKSILLIIFLSFGLTTETFAENKINYRGIKVGKAWININGRIAKLTPGQSSREGYKLLNATKKHIVLMIDGERYKFNKGKKEGILLEDFVSLTRNPINGAYIVEGAVNEQKTIFIVDTGATFVVLNKKDAKALDVKYGKSKVKVSTATKDEYAYQTTLKSVRIGGIELYDIPALVTKNKTHPRLPLLGMSFLEKLEINQSGNKMRLVYKGE